MCMAHSHPKPVRHTPEQSTSREAPMACEHHPANGLSQCSMTCCQSSTQSFVAAIVFVLPAPLLLSRTPRFVIPLIVHAPHELLPPIAPPDLPPRLLPS